MQTHDAREDPHVKLQTGLNFPTLDEPRRAMERDFAHDHDAAAAVHTRAAACACENLTLAVTHDDAPIVSHRMIDACAHVTHGVWPYTQSRGWQRRPD